MAASPPATDRLVRRRTSSLRMAGAMGALGAVLAMAHALLDAPPHRSAIVAVAGAYLIPGLALALLAPSLARSARRSRAGGAFMVVTVAATMAMVALEGTVAGPLGLLIVGPLTLIATLARRRVVIASTALIMGAYAAIALMGDAGPRGYAFVHVVSLLTLVIACALRREAMLRDQAELARLADTDPLTGCLNRRGFEKRLAAELERGPSRLLLVTLDLDAFKAVNDTLGHDAGDLLLCWAATAVRATLGPHDAIGRIGGDEFAVMLPGRGDADASAACSVIGAAVAAHAAASVGSAAAAVDGDTVDALQASADARMYAAKHARPSADEVVRRAATLPATDQRSAEPTAPGRSRDGAALRTIAAMHLVGFGVGLAYALTTIDAVGHAEIAFIGLAGSVAASLILVTDGLGSLPQIPRRLVLLTYTVCAIFATFAFSVYDGGPGNPIGAAMMIPVMAKAFAARPRTVAVVTALLAALYGAATAMTQPGPPGYVRMLLIVTAAVAAACCAQQTELVKQRRRLARLSRTDPLTGCLNRRGFGERLSAALNASRRTYEPVALVTIDLDGFKQVNDRLGHAAGDELLRWAAGAVGACLRAVDAVGRMGGDEFSILLPGATPEVGERVAARIAAVLAERARASVGHAGFPHDAGDVESLQRVADERMYAHKRTRAAAPQPSPARSGSG